MLLNSHISAYTRCLAEKVCGLVRSTSGTSQGEDKLGARDKILNTKGVRRANIPPEYCKVFKHVRQVMHSCFGEWRIQGKIGPRVQLPITQTLRIAPRMVLCCAHPMHIVNGGFTRTLTNSLKSGHEKLAWRSGGSLCSTTAKPC